MKLKRRVPTDPKKKKKRKRKKGGGIKKGRPLELEIAKDLSAWMTEGERTDVFYHSAGSGSRFTKRQKVGLDTANSSGDISLLDPIGQPFLDVFSVEIKRGYNKVLDLFSIVDGTANKKPTLIEWIKKAELEIEQAKRPEYMIIMKRDYKKKCVCISGSFMVWLVKQKVSFTPEMILRTREVGVISIVDYDEFFAGFNMRLLSKYRKLKC